MTKQFVHGFKRIYSNKFIKDHKPINKHHIKYKNDKYAPAWKTLEFLTFGSIITLFNSIREDSMRLKIAEQYSIKSLNVFKSFLTTMRFLRNICAHSTFLFDNNTPFEIRTSSLIDFEGKDRHCMNSVIKVLLYLLNQISTNRHDIIRKEISDLFLKFEKNKLIREIIENKIKFTF